MSLAQRVSIPMLLKVQYRQPPALGAIMSEVFYAGSVTNLVGVPTPRYACVRLCAWPDWWYNVALEALVPAKPEALLASRLYRKLRVEYAGKEVKVLTPYQAQVDLLLSDRVPQCDVSTVDSFQGQETDIVIFTFSRWERMGFLRDIRRLNVATSRARFLLIILANESIGRSYNTYTRALPDSEDIPGEEWWSCYRRFFCEILVQNMSWAI